MAHFPGPRPTRTNRTDEGTGVTAYEVIRDPTTGEALASVCVTAPLTDDERAVLVEYFQWRQCARDHDAACGMCDDNGCGTRESG